MSWARICKMLSIPAPVCQNTCFNINHVSKDLLIMSVVTMTFGWAEWLGGKKNNVLSTCLDRCRSICFLVHVCTLSGWGGTSYLVT